MQGGTRYAAPKDWHLVKASYRAAIANVPVGTIHLHARTICNRKIDGEWQFPTTGYNMTLWAEVHSPVNAPLEDRYRGSIKDLVEGETC